MIFSIMFKHIFEIYKRANEEEKLQKKQSDQHNYI